MFQFRGENILLFLVQTAGRQIAEQKQYRTSRSRGASSQRKPADVGKYRCVSVSTAI